VGVCAALVGGVSAGSAALSGTWSGSGDVTTTVLLEELGRPSVSLATQQAVERLASAQEGRLEHQAAQHEAGQRFVEARRKAEEEAQRKAEEKAAREAEEAEARAAAEREAAAEQESRSTQRADSDPKAAARAMLADYGWGDDQFSCLDSLWERESNWNHLAQNPSSGAYGIPQALPGDKMASAGDDWQTNPITQITWGLGYIDERYGTPCGAWSHSESVGWY
jgi:hypothetical protein